MMLISRSKVIEQFNLNLRNQALLLSSGESSSSSSSSESTSPRNLASVFLFKSSLASYFFLLASMCSLINSSPFCWNTPIKCSRQSSGKKSCLVYRSSSVKCSKSILSVISIIPVVIIGIIFSSRYCLMGKDLISSRKCFFSSILAILLLTLFFAYPTTPASLLVSAT